MPSEPTSLLDLDNWRSRPSWLLTVGPPGPGGRFGESPMELIAENQGARALRICGLDQVAFERLVAGYGSQFSAIIFHGCQRVADLSPLEDLPGLQLVSWEWNQRATRLWDMSRTPRLTGLKVEDFIHLRALDDLQGCTGLEELVFGDGIASRKAVFDSLEPLAALENLRYLEFCVRRIDDGRIQPLGKLSRLQELKCPVNLFTTRQLAWLRARLPAAQSQSLDPVMPFGQVLTLDGKPKDVALVGKRKPVLNSLTDQARITKHVDEFWQMVEDFRRNPALEPGEAVLRPNICRTASLVTARDNGPRTTDAFTVARTRRYALAGHHQRVVSFDPVAMKANARATFRWGRLDLRHEGSPGSRTADSRCLRPPRTSPPICVMVGNGRHTVMAY